MTNHLLFPQYCRVSYQPQVMTANTQVRDTADWGKETLTLSQTLNDALLCCCVPLFSPSRWFIQTKGTKIGQKTTKHPQAIEKWLWK